MKLSVKTLKIINIIITVAAVIVATALLVDLVSPDWYLLDVTTPIAVFILYLASLFNIAFTNKSLKPHE